MSANAAAVQARYGEGWGTNSGGGGESTSEESASTDSSVIESRPQGALAWSSGTILGIDMAKRRGIEMDKGG